MEHDVFELLKIRFDIANKRAWKAEQKAKECFANQDFNMAAYWTIEERKAWDECEHIRITMKKMTGEL